MRKEIIGDAELYLGDCLEILPTLPKVDSVITDPPYEAEAHTRQRRVRRGAHSVGIDDRAALSPSLSFEPLSFEPLSFEQRAEYGKHIAKLTKRWALVFCQCEAAHLWRRELEPLAYRRTAVWVKPDAMPQFSGDRPGMGYESIVCCHAAGRSTWNGGGRVGVFIHNKNSGGKHDHQTQKPVPLMVELLTLFTDSRETILDPFMGSGTTGVACMNLGRKFIGIEVEEKYFDIACRRIDYAQRQARIFGFDDTLKLQERIFSE